MHYAANSLLIYLVCVLCQCPLGLLSMEKMLQSCSLFHLGCVQHRGNQICWNFLIWSRFVSWPPIFVITNFYYICSLKHLLQILPRLAFTTINCSFQIFLANCCIKIGKYTCLFYFDPKYKCISWFYYKLKHLVKLLCDTYRYHSSQCQLSYTFMSIRGHLNEHHS